MTTYRLSPKMGAETFHRIKSGKKFVGRVFYKLIAAATREIGRIK